MRYHILTSVVALLFLWIAAGCAPEGGASYSPERETTSSGSLGEPSSPAPLFEGMGPHRRAVTTANPQAQRYFDQGLTWTFAFNHDEAIRSFRQAGALDPDLAMAWWGIALCNGPHINNVAMPAERSKAAWEALQKAAALASKASPVERDLIEALARRYADPPPADRRPLDEAYAAAMREVWKKYPGDADVGALYAESLMDLRPWDLWTPQGEPRPETPEIIAVLKRVLTLQPRHPGAMHFLIHTVEASPHPEEALPAADGLRGLVPISGHLEHMPAHIYARVGRWSDAAACNETAIAADRRYRALSPRQAFYRFYMAHNHHFLAWACMMQGRSGAALQAAREMIAGIPADYVRENAAVVDPFMAIEIEVLMRFGKWDDILKQPAPPVYLPITRALRHFARGAALAARGDVAGARREARELQAAIDKVPKDAVQGNNRAHDCLAVAVHVLRGETALARRAFDEAVSELRKGVELEDALRYDEAPDWIQPVRHSLGAVLLRAGRPAEARQVYEEDLHRWPENGWALFGLAESLRAQGASAEAARAEERFRKAWAQADVSIGSSCLCAARR